MNQSKILPFYMAYPLPMYYQEEDSVTRDLEYLQQMYPMEAKRYQKIIMDTLGQIDYEGSMIYDEYPDKWQLYRLTQTIMDKIKRMEETALQNAVREGSREQAGQEMAGEGNEVQTGEGTGENRQAGMLREKELPWEWIEAFVQVLLYYEIYRKRHASHRGILKF